MANQQLYCAITTKTRCLKKKLLKEDDFTTLASCASVPEAVLYLKKNEAYAPYFNTVDENALHRGDIERLLYGSLHDEFAKLYKFAGSIPRKYLELFLIKFEIGFIKGCMRMVFNKQTATAGLTAHKDFFAKFADFDVSALITAQNMEEFVAVLKGSKFYPTFERLSGIGKTTLFDYEIGLDMFYFSKIWKSKDKLTGEDAIAIAKEEGVRMDLLNISWIYRSKKFYNMNATDIYALLIPYHGKLRKHEVTALVESADDAAFLSALKTTYYAKDAQELTEEQIEPFFAKIVRDTYKSVATKSPYSVASLANYIYTKELEIEKLVTIVECIRYHLEVPKIQAYLGKH